MPSLSDIMVTMGFIWATTHGNLDRSCTWHPILRMTLLNFRECLKADWGVVC